jgi:hypothetical protein
MSHRLYSIADVPPRSSARAAYAHRPLAVMLAPRLRDTTKAAAH